MTSYLDYDLTDEQKARWRQWAQALESGNYQQGIGYLRLENKDDHAMRWCCLGVVCDVAVTAHLDLEVSTQDYTSRLSRKYDGEDSVLPVKVQEWLGVKSSSPMLLKVPEAFGHFTPVSAYRLNDTYRLTFYQLARLIRHIADTGMIMTEQLNVVRNWRPEETTTPPGVNGHE